VKILLSAFSCSPAGGSEGAVGWNWAVATAERGHEVVVLTPSGDEQSIAAADTPETLSFVFVREPRGADLVPGQLHWYVRYLRWQWAARRAAAGVLAGGGFDVVHHLTWASLQLGTFLGDLGPPLVFGPVGGGQTAPRALRTYYRGRWATELLRTIVTRALIRADPFAVRTMRQAAIAVADNDETATLMRRLGAGQVRQHSQCGVSEDDLRPPDPARRDEPELVLLWVGRFMPRKGLPLALEAMRRVPDGVPVRLRIVGYGPQDDDVSGWVDELGLGDRVELVGQVPYADMVATYRQADALLFTSIRDSGGIQLVEAMGQGLPCIVLKHQGAKLLVPPTAGLRVDVTTAVGTAVGLATAITRLAGDRDLWWTLANGAHEQAARHTWAALVGSFEPILDAAVAARSRR
jgi:glycosyltransferase involved in cell wall biosynthesis